jgi:hypothetical protein
MNNFGPLEWLHSCPTFPIQDTSKFSFVKAPPDYWETDNPQTTSPELIHNTFSKKRQHRKVTKKSSTVPRNLEMSWRKGEKDVLSSDSVNHDENLETHMVKYSQEPKSQLVSSTVSSPRIPRVCRSSKDGLLAQHAIMMFSLAYGLNGFPRMKHKDLIHGMMTLTNCSLRGAQSLLYG